MTTKVQTKPARHKSPVVGKSDTRRPAAKAVGASTIPARSKRMTTEASIATVTPVAATKAVSAIRPHPSSKLGIVLTLLEKPQGASLAKLIEVTGWLPHTTRAALTGLRKRGFLIVNEKVEGGGASVYRIRSEAA